jgi:hypothetical protein
VLVRVLGTPSCLAAGFSGAPPYVQKLGLKRVPVSATAPESIRDGEIRTRTGDTTIFRRVRCPQSSGGPDQMRSRLGSQSERVVKAG